MQPGVDVCAAPEQAVMHWIGFSMPGWTWRVRNGLETGSTRLS